MANLNYGKLTTRLIAVWFIFSLAASALHVFRTDPGRPPLPLGLSALIPIALFLLWFATSERFRQFTLALNPRILTIVQTWRTAGFVFLVLYTYGILPGMFALPAGWGDIAIGATAPLVAMKLATPEHRKGFIFWQILGIADLVDAVFLGATAAFFNPQGTPTSAMTVLPMSLIPTFIVPLLLIFHVICIAQARRWHARSYSGIGNPLPFSAA
ncbi:MAG TPA: hypothetical protein VG168_04500 [Bryobacteraceae bacterium]|jgi:hypothetical protein|nr:hypothetical protein [Bryobacteraceae bacterium]